MPSPNTFIDCEKAIKIIAIQQPTFTAIFDNFSLQKAIQKSLQPYSFGSMPNGWYDVFATNRLYAVYPYRQPSSVDRTMVDHNR